MTSTTKWIIGIVVLIIIIIAAFMLFGSNNANAPTQTASVAQESSSTTPEGSAATSTTPTAQTTTVTLTDAGFSPASVTIHQGDSVIWVNQSKGMMWVASAPHPVHTAYDGTSRTEHCAAGYTGPAPFDECASVGSGGTFTFTFDKTGTWHYHDHMNPTLFGTVIVQ